MNANENFGIGKKLHVSIMVLVSVVYENHIHILWFKTEPFQGLDGVISVLFRFNSLSLIL